MAGDVVHARTGTELFLVAEGVVLLDEGREADVRRRSSRCPPPGRRSRSLSCHTRRRTRGARHSRCGARRTCTCRPCPSAAAPETQAWGVEGIARDGRVAVVEVARAVRAGRHAHAAPDAAILVHEDDPVPRLEGRGDGADLQAMARSRTVSMARHEKEPPCLSWTSKTLIQSKLSGR